MYSPEIEPEIMHKLYLMKQRTNITIKTLVNSMLSRALHQEESIRSIGEILEAVKERKEEKAVNSSI